MPNYSCFSLSKSRLHHLKAIIKATVKCKLDIFHWTVVENTLYMIQQHWHLICRSPLLNKALMLLNTVKTTRNSKTHTEKTILAKDKKTESNYLKSGFCCKRKSLLCLDTVFGLLSPTNTAQQSRRDTRTSCKTKSTAQS